MRIVCPNCGAQYEIPDEVIPESGRDVQCSNCGETWFQNHPSNPQAARPAEETAPDENEPEPADWTEPDDTPEEAPGTRSTGTGGRRQRLDPEVADVLREEAEHEARARAAETGGGLETQPDLGLSSGEEDTRSRQARERMARLRGATTPDDGHGQQDAAGMEPPSRRNFLPDIEELDPAVASGPRDERADTSARDGSAAAAPDTGRPGGFRRGMRLAIVLAIIATAIYMFTPRIAELLPAASEPLSAYVEAVNDLRVALNERAGVLLEQLRGLTGG